MLDNTLFISLGKNHILKDSWQEVSSETTFYNKPFCGGLWAGLYTKNSISEWYQYCKECDFVTYSEGVIFKIDKKAKVFIIDDKNDLKNFISLVDANFKKIGFSSKFEKIVGLNFCKVKKIYDAIYLTEKGVKDTQEILKWDCESLFILNYNVIHEYNSIKLI